VLTELRANARHVASSRQHALQDQRTMLAYQPKQREFQAFCRQKQYNDADTVTEEKLLLFLVEQVATDP
jgi:hypothetical protein